MEVSDFSKNCLLVAKLQVCAGKLLSYKLHDFVGWQNLAQSMFGIGLSTLGITEVDGVEANAITNPTLVST